MRSLADAQPGRVQNILQNRTEHPRTKSLENFAKSLCFLCDSHLLTVYTQAAHVIVPSVFGENISAAEFWNDIGRNACWGIERKKAKFLMRTFTCRSTFLYVMKKQIAEKKIIFKDAKFLVTILALPIKKFTKLNHVNEARINKRIKRRARGLPKLFIEAAAA